MENITLGQIAKGLAFIVALIGSVVYLKKGTIKGLSKVIDSQLEPIKKEIKGQLEPIKIEIKSVKREIKEVKEETAKNNLSSIKTDLINLMELADKKTISAEQKIRSYELYDYYCKHGGNSYVHDKWEKLKKEGKI